MGSECSNCRCTNREDEKVLIIENNDRIHNPKNGDLRKGKLEQIEKSQTSNKTRIFEILNNNPKLSINIVKLQSLIRKYRHRKTYKAILKKHRVKFQKIIKYFLIFNKNKKNS